MTGLLKRRWVGIAAALLTMVVALTVWRLNGIFGTNNALSRPDTDMPESAAFNPKRVQLQVFGNGGAVATINYIDADSQPRRVDDATLPWSNVLTTDEPVLYADIRAQGISRLLGCRIVVNGVTMQERSTTDQNGYVSCLLKSA